MHRMLPQQPQYKQSTRGREPGHEETEDLSEGSSSEEEEESADRCTEEGQHSDSVECMTFGTDCSSSGRISGRNKKAKECVTRGVNPETRNKTEKQDRTTQKTLLSPLPSVLMAPVYREVTISPSCRVTKVRTAQDQNTKAPTKPPKVIPKKRENCAGEEAFCIPSGNINWIPKQTPKTGWSAGHLPANSTGGNLEFLKSLPEEPVRKLRPHTASEPRRKRIVTEDRTSSAVLPDSKSEEVKEKLVYVVEENGNNITKVETDLFSLNEILTIKKDLLELSEFAKKLKRLKQMNREPENGKSEDGLCQCEPSAQVLRVVNQRIEALEMRQEELERGAVSGSGLCPKKDSKATSKQAKEVERFPHSGTLQNAAERSKTTVIATIHGFPKTEEPVSKVEGPCKTSYIVNELLDIKSQLQRLEQKRGNKMSAEEISPEGNGAPADGKKREIAVFTSKTYILTQENFGLKEEKANADDEMSKGSSTKPEEIPGGAKDRNVAPKCKSCSRSLDERRANDQEPQKNRATEDFVKSEYYNRLLTNSGSYNECFVSPSGKFFAWIKKSSDKLIKNLRAEKVPQRGLPAQLSRTTSALSILSALEKSIRNAKRGRSRERVLARIARSKSAGELGVWRRGKTAHNENARYLENRSLSRDKVRREGKNEAARRREPRAKRAARRASTSSSSRSELLDTFDFDGNLNSFLHYGRQYIGQRSPPMFVYTAECNEKKKKKREEEKKLREKVQEEREKKTTEKERKTEKRPKDGRPRWKKSEEEIPKQRKKERGAAPSPDSSDKKTCEKSLEVLRKYQEEKLLKGSLTGKPTDDRFSFKNILKSFSWLYSIFGSNILPAEFQEGKKEAIEKPTEEVPKTEKLYSWDDYDLEDDGSSVSERICRGRGHHCRRQRNNSHGLDQNHINSCDCVRVFLEAHMRKNLASLVQAHESENLNDASSGSDTVESASSGYLTFVKQKGIHVKHGNRKHRTQHRKKKKVRGKEPRKNDHRKRKRWDDEPICGKCRPNSTTSDPELGLRVRAEDLSSCCPIKNVKDKPENLPILSFLYQLYKSRYRQQKNPTADKTSPQPAKRELKILPEDDRKGKLKSISCSRCGHSFEMGFDHGLCNLEEIDEENLEECRRNHHGRKNTIRYDESRSYEVGSTDTTGLAENDGEYKDKEIKYHCRDDSDVYWQRGDDRNRRKKRKTKEQSVEESWQKDEATRCLFLNESQDNATDKTTETEDRAKKMRRRLSSIHSFWRTLRKSTREKALLGRAVGENLRRKAVENVSRLDVSLYDCSRNDSWPWTRRDYNLEQLPRAVRRKLKPLHRARREKGDGV